MVSPAKSGRAPLQGTGRIWAAWVVLCATAMACAYVHPAATSWLALCMATWGGVLLVPAYVALRESQHAIDIADDNLRRYNACADTLRRSARAVALHTATPCTTCGERSWALAGAVELDPLVAHPIVAAWLVCDGCASVRLFELQEPADDDRERKGAK